MTWSVKDGGRLCDCGHLKCSHEEGKGFCFECEISDRLRPDICAAYSDRAPETVAA